jgi:hypothetical protein
MSYLCCLCLFGSSFPPVVCRGAHCLIYVVCVCLVRLYLQLFVGGLMSYLCYLCLFAYSDVQHILCVAFVLFFIVLWAVCCHYLWIVHF